MLVTVVGDPCTALGACAYAGALVASREPSMLCTSPVLEENLVIVSEG